MTDFTTGSLSNHWQVTPPDQSEKRAQQHGRLEAEGFPFGTDEDLADL